MEYELTSMQDASSRCILGFVKTTVKAVQNAQGPVDCPVNWANSGPGLNLGNTSANGPDFPKVGKTRARARPPNQVHYSTPIKG